MAAIKTINLTKRFPRTSGYRVIARNWRCAAGEIDIVARDGPVLAVVEVRTRRGRPYGTPEESLTARKQRKLVELGQTYVQETGWPGPCE